MIETLDKKSIFLVSSTDEDNDHFGTGFVIKCDENLAYILTCSHVLNDVGGEGKVLVDEKIADVYSDGKDINIDLAVLTVPLSDLVSASAFNLRKSANSGEDLSLEGFYIFNDGNRDTYAQKELHCELESSLQLKPKSNLSNSSKAWELSISEAEEVKEFFSKLREGYSGSPIYNNSGHVVAVVTHKAGVLQSTQEGKFGYALCISNLKKLCQKIYDELVLPPLPPPPKNKFNYEYDIFLSYRDFDIAGDWVRECLKPLLTFYLEAELGERPKIFIAKQEPRDILSSHWSTLVKSRCVIPIWAPSYLELSWATYECLMFKSRLQKNHNSLIFPVLIASGRRINFGNCTPHAQKYFDCQNYVYDPSVLKTSSEFIKLHEDVKRWVVEIADAIENAPSWKDDWLDECNTLAKSVTHSIPVSSFPQPLW